MRNVLLLVLLCLSQTVFAERQGKTKICNELRLAELMSYEKQILKSDEGDEFYHVCDISNYWSNPNVTQDARDNFATIIVERDDIAVFVHSEWSAQFLSQDPYLVRASTPDGEVLLRVIVNGELPYTVILQDNHLNDVVVYR
jgi:hypothetical protein